MGETPQKILGRIRRTRKANQVGSTKISPNKRGSSSHEFIWITNGSSLFGHTSPFSGHMVRSTFLGGSEDCFECFQVFSWFSGSFHTKSFALLADQRRIARHRDPTQVTAQSFAQGFCLGLDAKKRPRAWGSMHLCPFGKPAVKSGQPSHFRSPSSAQPLTPFLVGRVPLLK